MLPSEPPPPTGGKVFLTTPGAGTKVSPGSSVDVFIL